jgi:hypothetical protein
VIVSLGQPFRILALDGPFKGAANDLTIFRMSTLNRLLKNERVIADRGYVKESMCWTPPLGSMLRMSEEDKLKRRKVTRIRQLNERMIGRLKFWGVFCKKWHHSFSFHQLCAQVVGALTQLEIFYSPMT